MTGWLAPLLVPGLSAVALIALLGYRAASGVFELVRRVRLARFSRHDRSEVTCAVDRTAPPPCSP